MSAKYLYGIVTLIDLGQRPKQLTERLISLAEAVNGTEFSLTIGHSDRSTTADDDLRRRLSCYAGHGIRLVSVISEQREAELAKLRNVAMQVVDENIILLVDVDIFPHLQLFRFLAKALEAGTPLAIAPCIYLSPAGNRALEHAAGLARIAESLLGFSQELVLHCALPSSVMAFSRSDYWTIGGFHESYLGHGYEDFDFMLRLALHAGLIAPSGDLLIDRSYRAPLLSTGFRAVLGRLCLTNLLDGNIAFHLHHEKDPYSSYQVRRSANAEIFQKRIRELIGSKITSESIGVTQKLINDFFAECGRRGIDPEQFHALFDARPRHLLIQRPWWIRAKRSLSRFVS